MSGKIHIGFNYKWECQSNSAYINGKVEGDLVVREKVV